MPWYKLIEWDMDNGEVIESEMFKAVDDEDAWNYLEDVIREAEQEGWECEDTGSEAGYVCVKRVCDGGECYELRRQVTVEPVD